MSERIHQNQAIRSIALENSFYRRILASLSWEVFQAENHGRYQQLVRLETLQKFTPKECFNSYRYEE